MSSTYTTYFYLNLLWHFTLFIYLYIDVYVRSFPTDQKYVYKNCYDKLTI